jgi:hypothetical protein
MPKLLQKLWHTAPPLSAPFAAYEFACDRGRLQGEIPCDCNRIGPAHSVPGDDDREVLPIEWAGFGKREPKPDDFNWGTPRLPAATRCLNVAKAKRVQAHRVRARMGLRCLTVRVSDRI